MSKDAEDYVLDHKLVWTGWKNNPKFLLDQRQKDTKEKEQHMSEKVEEQGGSEAENAVLPKRRMGKYLSTAQAAERLGVTLTTVGSMVRRGQLKNMWEPPEGKTVERHQIALDAVEVREFAKTYRNRALPGMLRKMRGEGNGQAKEVAKPKGRVKLGTKRGPYHKKPKTTPTASQGKVYLISEDSPVQGFMSQIKAMKVEMAETKAQVAGLVNMVEDVAKGVEQLVKMWS